MAAINPFKAAGYPLGSMPNCWKTVTPHATNFIFQSGSDHHVALGLYCATDSDVTYYDAVDTGTSKTVKLKGGLLFPGAFTRVTASTSVDPLLAGFIL